MTDPETGQGQASHHWHQGAGACEIEVDRETGKIRVLRFSGASFAGQVINPELAKLQNDGNVIYGMGPALVEEMVVQGGQVVNANLSDYLIPSFLDAPEELVSAALEAEGSEFHGIGEMTLPPVAPAIANAFDYRVRIRDLPTAEKDKGDPNQSSSSAFVAFFHKLRPKGAADAVRGYAAFPYRSTKMFWRDPMNGSSCDPGVGGGIRPIF
jgi:hypothetical protein